MKITLFVVFVSVLVSLAFVPHFQLGDNCIQNFHMGRYIDGYTVGNLVLKRDFSTYIRQYTSQNENCEYGYHHVNALLQCYINLKQYIRHKFPCNLTKCDAINDVKLSPTVYRRIYCCKFLTLTNKTSHYKSKCIRIRG